MPGVKRQLSLRLSAGLKIFTNTNQAGMLDMEVAKNFERLALWDSLHAFSP